MANQDARPFVDLRKDAQEFQAKFDEDIKECISFLDSKITALICDPDSLGNPVGSIKQNALLEFSKSKYDIFISIKNLINNKEREWLAYISEMKKLFVENVEIFLAATKLEVKLPSSEYQSSLGSRNSSGSRKSISSVLNNIAKNIPVLSSPLCNKETTSHTDISNVKNDVQSTKSGRLSAKFSIAPGTSATISLDDQEDMDVSDNSENESRRVGGGVQFNRRGRLSIKLNNSPRVTSSLDQKDALISSDSSENEIETENEIAENVDIVIEEEPTVEVVKAKSRRGRSAAPKSSNKTVYENAIAENENIGITARPTVEVVKVKGRRGRPVAPKSSNKTSSENAIAENENIVITARPTVEVVKVKSRRGRPAAPKNSNKTVSETEMANNATVVSGEQPTVEIVRAKGRRGRSAVPNNSNNAISVPLSQNINKTSSDEHSESDVYSSINRPAKSNARRKTLLPRLDDIPDFEVIPGRTASKRKTVSGASGINSAAPPKRLRACNENDAFSIQEDADDDNLLGSDDNYSEWLPLKNIDGKIPSVPAVYEVKVWRAKKSAYIGFSESLRQKLTLYKLRQNSGHKHLDKFLDRNFNDIQIRFETMPSVEEAKDEVKSRVKRFVEQHKTTPAYN